MALSTQEEYAWFFRGEYPSVVRTAYLVLQDRGAAEDAAQEAFVQLFRHWKKISRYEKPEAWVRRVAIRIAVKALRKQKLTTVLNSEIEIPVIESSTDPDLMKAVAKLPGQQRAAVVLFYFEDRPVQEIAQIMDCSEATAKVHLHRARKKLAELLGEEVTADVD